MATLALLLLGFSLSAQAEPPGAPPEGKNYEGQPAPQRTDGAYGVKPGDPSDQPAGEAPRDQDEPSGPAGPMSIDDARMNFATVIESFVAAHSRDGYWPLKQKSTGKVLKLRYERVLPDSVREFQEGRFRGRAVLREVEAGFPVKADFTVDFSGSQWQVESLRLVSADPPARKPLRKAPARRRAPERSAEPD